MAIDPRAAAGLADILGVERANAMLIYDLASHAAHEGLATMKRVTDGAPRHLQIHVFQCALSIVRGGIDIAHQRGLGADQPKKQPLWARMGAFLTTRKGE